MNKVESSFSEGQKAFGCDSMYVTGYIVFDSDLLFFQTRWNQKGHFVTQVFFSAVSVVCGTVDIYSRISWGSNSAQGQNLLIMSFHTHTLLTKRC